MITATQESQKALLSNDPFLIRKCIVLSGLVAGILGGLGGWNPVLGLAAYFCWVTLWDGLSHYVLHLKASSFANPEELLKSERVTGEELDHYFDTRRYIRFASLAVATGVFGLSFFLFPYALEAFCIAYVMCTLLGILSVRLFSKRRRPRLIYRDERYDNPPWPKPDTGGYRDYVRWSKGEIAPMKL
ncbi:MAG: hypothetical protein KBD36_06045 [Alphaproteobacteria bacterium]|nr:hypothetical protein [Alphaproteobacteria bacterium]MBP9777382.1 hypothetical protein [Alphaproteobacteria bacterium]